MQRKDDAEWGRGRWGPRFRTTDDFANDFAIQLEEERAQAFTTSSSLNLATASTSTDSVPADQIQSFMVEDPNDKKKFQVEDYQVPYASNETVRDWYNRFPALSKRNFYLVQRHNATSKHYDLRIQLDNKTISFAIPKGLSEFPTYDHESKGIRQGIETTPHSIGYTLFEGTSGTSSTTSCWDLGSYKILKTKKAMEEKKKYDNETTTDEDDLEEEDVKQENLFRTAYRRAARLVDSNLLPAQEDAGRESGGGSTRGFVIELNGARYKGLKLLFSHRQLNTQSSTPRGHPKDINHVVNKRLWMISLQDKKKISSRGREAPIGDVSILTGRTMDQILADRSKDRDCLIERMRKEGEMKKYFELLEDECGSSTI